MARSLICFSLGGLLALGAAGCANQNSVVESLPAPSFNGPTIVAAPAPMPKIAIAPPPAAPSPRRGTLGGDKGWTPVAAARPWKWIVIHHSATPSGSASEFDKMHKAKGWDELGYHFVIGNGTQSGNGQVEVGPRWPKQKWGAHAKTPDNKYNDYGIGICLVGNFDIERPTPQQTQALSKLVAYLMRTYKIPASNVLGHRDTKPTDCPGRNINIAQIRRMATQVLVDAGEDVQPDGPRTASADAGELLQNN